MSKEIELTWNELWAAASTGVYRQITSLKRKGKNSHGFNGKNAFEIHIQGAAAEMALAKSLDMYYTHSVDTFAAPDVGPYQVRSTQMDPPALIVRPNDKDDEVFILVTSDFPKFTIHGWMTGAEAKNKKWEANPHGRGAAYFVPHGELNDMTKLPKVKKNGNGNGK